MDKDPAYDKQLELEPIGTIDTWIASLSLDPVRFGGSTSEQMAQAATSIQRNMISVASRLSTSMVGFYQSGEQPRLVLTRWPEDREGSVVPEIDKCQAARDELAAALGATEDDRQVIPPGRTIVLLGTMEGYSDKQAVTVEEIADHLSGFEVDQGIMVCVRIAHGEVVEEWSESVGIVEAGYDQLGAIYDWAVRSKQAHFPVHGEQQTCWYKTRWALPDNSSLSA